MLFRKEIEKCHFEINYEFNKLRNDQKEFIDSNFDLISIITKKQGNDFLVEYKQTTEPTSKIVRSHGGVVNARSISYYYKNNRITFSNRNYLLANLNLTLFHKFSRLKDCLNEENNASRI